MPPTRGDKIGGGGSSVGNGRGRGTSTTIRHTLRDDALADAEDDGDMNGDIMEGVTSDDADVEPFEPFEPGNPWSQKVPSQIQRKNWRKVVYMEPTSSPQEAHPLPLLIGERTAERRERLQQRRSPSPSTCKKAWSGVSRSTVCSLVSPSPPSPSAIPPPISQHPSQVVPTEEVRFVDDDDNDEVIDIENRPPIATLPSRQQERGRTRESSKPWWSDGKTAPLLGKFDGNRRSFYLAQAGVREVSDDADPGGLHSFQGRQDRTENVTGSVAPPAGLPYIHITPTRTLTSTSAAFTLPNHHPSPITLQRTKALSLSLAGNANSPMAEKRLTIATTPRKKTWDATWGKDGQRNEGPTSNKKSKLAARPNPSSALQQGRGRTGTAGSLGARRVVRKTT